MMKKNGRFSWSLLSILLIITVLVVGLSTDPTVTAARQAKAAAIAAEPQMYIVLFEGPSVVGKLVYENGRSLNTSGLSAQMAQRSLQYQQSLAIDEMTSLLKRPLSIPYQYTIALNGLAVELTAAEAAEIAGQPGIRAVVVSQLRSPLTDTGPAWIGAPSLWDGSQTGGIEGTMGEGIVIGIIDTGINMDHPSFAAVGGDGYVHTNPNGTGVYLGHCATQPGSSICNDKLIGAYSWPEVGDDPEDYSSHGSNVAGIAAGNVITVPYTAPTIVLTPTLSGVAPHANIIAYDVCQRPFVPGQTSTCPDFVSIRAVEQAIIDGVDVLNFSIGSEPSNPWQDPLSLAFLSAREAGIFVATAAGNDGSGAGTINAPANSPWMTTVGNVTHNGRFNNTLTPISGGSGPLPSPITGSSITGGHGPAPIVSAVGITNTSGTLDDGTCQTSFPAATWTNGEIVLCRYGGGSAYTKANRVLAGGAGGVLVDIGHDVSQAMGIERLGLPGLNIRSSDAITLDNWLASGASHIAEIQGTIRQHNASYADELYFNSSRGPALYAPDVLKPNVSAPGVLIWSAGRSTDTSTPPEFSFYRGTSQASPHVAGSAVLLKALHPDWTPAEIESALMMTAVSTITLDDGSPAGVFGRGAGRVELTAVSRAGLVLDETGANFRAANPALGHDASQLNLASLTDANCGTTCTWTRQLRSTLPVTTTWDIDITQSVTAVLTISPTTFTLPPGQMQTIVVTAVADSLPLETWDFGTVLLTETSQQAPDAHLPVTLKRVESNLVENIEIHTRQDASSHLQTNLQAPGIITLTAKTYELVRGVITETQIAQNGTLTLTLTVPADSKQLAVEIVASTAPDVDMYIQESGAAQGTACSAEGPWWLERCNVLEPVAGEYEIVLKSFTGSGQPVDDLSLVTAVVPDQPATNNWVTGPLGQGITEPFDLRIFWQEPALEPGERWYGGLELGTKPATPDDLGFIPITLIRYPDDVGKTVTPTAATLASEITTTITIQPNVTPLNLGYVLTETIPAGLTVTTITAPPGTMTQTDSYLRWEGVLPPLGTETAVFQYQAIIEAAACNQSLTSTLHYVDGNPGSQPGTLSSEVDVVCSQLYLPAIYLSVETLR